MTKKINSIQCGLMLCLTTISLKFLTYPSVFASYTYKDVYVLPEGCWLYRGEREYRGGTQVCVAAPLGVLPYFVLKK